MTEAIAGQLEQAVLFILMGFVLTWLAKRYGFFNLPKQSLPPKIHYPFLGLLLYILLFLFAVPFAIKFLIIVYRPLKFAFKAHPSLLIGAAQVLSVMLVTCFVLIFSFFQDKGVIKTVWKEEFTLLSALKDFGLGILTWVISFPLIGLMDQIGNLLTFLIFGVSQVEQVAVRYIRLSTESPYLFSIALISTLIAAPILEEWIFRGFMQTYLKAKIGFFKALACTSLIFALFHISPAQGIGNFTLVFPLFTLALYLGFLYEKRKSLIAPIGLHMTFNSISVIRIVLFSN